MKITITIKDEETSTTLVEKEYKTGATDGKYEYAPEVNMQDLVDEACDNLEEIKANEADEAQTLRDLRNNQ